MVVLLQLIMLMEMLDAQEFLNIFFASVLEFACVPDELYMIPSLNVKAVSPNGIPIEIKTC